MAINNDYGQVLPLRLLDKQALYAAYMPLVKELGLFIRTNKPFALGDEVSVLLELIEQPEKFTLQGKVIWFTPLGAENKQPPGIGIQIAGDIAKELRAKIEAYLADFPMVDVDTDTL